MFQIQIPKPCHEDWATMTPTTKGAFCKSCAKEVVDFTKMTDDEIKNFFLNKTAGVCGRFNAAQIHRVKIELPQCIFHSKIAAWKKYLAIVLLAFGSMLFGCDVNTNQKHTTTVKLSKSLDTLSKPSNCPTMVGDTVVMPPQQVVGFTPPKVIEQRIVLPVDQITMGEPAFVPVSKVDSAVLANDSSLLFHLIDTLITRPISNFSNK